MKLSNNKIKTWKRETMKNQEEEYMQYWGCLVWTCIRGTLSQARSLVVPHSASGPRESPSDIFSQTVPASSNQTSPHISTGPTLPLAAPWRCSHLLCLQNQDSHLFSTQVFNGRCMVGKWQGTTEDAGWSRWELWICEGGATVHRSVHTCT